MREKIAQFGLVMYGAGLQDGKFGFAQPSIIISKELDELMAQLREEIEKVEDPYSDYLQPENAVGFAVCQKKILALLKE